MLVPPQERPSADAIMGLVALLALLIAVTILWFALVKIVKQVCQYPASKRICLLIAHCDDEAMFFSPTVIRLADPSLNNHFEIICLSNGKISPLYVSYLQCFLTTGR